MPTSQPILDPTAEEYRAAAHDWQRKWQQTDAELQACKALLEKLTSTKEPMPWIRAAAHERYRGWLGVR